MANYKMVKRCDYEPCAYHQKYGHSVNISSRSKKAKWHLNLYHKKMGLVVSPVTAPIHRQTAKSRIKPNSLSQKIRLWVSPGTAPLNHPLSRTQTNAHDTFINAWQWSVHQELIITDQYISVNILKKKNFCESLEKTWPIHSLRRICH